MNEARINHLYQISLRNNQSNTNNNNNNHKNDRLIRLLRLLKLLNNSQVEENLINFFEVFLFFSSYFWKKTYKKLKFINIVIIGLRFKILLRKILKLNELGKKKKWYEENQREIELIDDTLNDNTLVSTNVTVDDTNIEEINNEKNTFEQIWRDSSQDENVNIDNSLINYQSINEDIKNLKMEMFVELIDLVLLLYPINLFEKLYNYLKLLKVKVFKKFITK